jgi:hypothetical protein
METVQGLIEKLLLDKDQMKAFTVENATDFLAFISKFITDINFKISISAIKIVSLLHEEKVILVTKHYNEVISQLIEKLSDSKQSMRDVTLECCAKIIKASQPALFAGIIVKDL